MNMKSMTITKAGILSIFIWRTSALGAKQWEGPGPPNL